MHVGTLHTARHLSLHSAIMHCVERVHCRVRVAECIQVPKVNILCATYSLYSTLLQNTSTIYVRRVRIDRARERLRTRREVPRARRQPRLTT